MDRNISNTLFMTCSLLIMCLVWKPSFCDAEISKTGNPYLLNLPSIYQTYLQEISDLSARVRRAETKDEKRKIKSQRSEKRDELKNAIAKFNQTSPLKDTKLPFKVSGNLPFTVQTIYITNVDYNSVDFIIQVKINEDIKNDKGEIEQRVSIYFVAVDSKNKIIPDTANWATNHGWINLSAGTVYEAQGHWNADRVQNMATFDSLRILSEEDYKKIK